MMTNKQDDDESQLDELEQTAAALLVGQSIGKYCVCVWPIVALDWECPNRLNWLERDGKMPQTGTSHKRHSPQKATVHVSL